MFVFFSNRHVALILNTKKSKTSLKNAKRNVVSYLQFHAVFQIHQQKHKVHACEIWILSLMTFSHASSKVLLRQGQPKKKKNELVHLNFLCKELYFKNNKLTLLNQTTLLSIVKVFKCNFLFSWIVKATPFNTCCLYMVGE